MDDALIQTSIVARFGRERTTHQFRVAVVGDDETGYRVQTRTGCGRVFDDTTKTLPGVITCDECEASDG